MPTYRLAINTRQLRALLTQFGAWHFVFLDSNGVDQIREWTRQQPANKFWSYLQNRARLQIVQADYIDIVESNRHFVCVSTYIICIINIPGNY